jgi:SAM-dependent methyltransferase
MVNGEWFEDEVLWEKIFPFLFREERMEAAEEEIERVCALVKVQCGSVLDLCCGPGRHSLALAKKGFQVTGLDLSAFLLNKARTLAKSRKLSVEWVRGDMRKFRRPGAFNLVLNLFTSFGYFQEEASDLKVLKRVHQNLQKDGIALFDMMGKELLAGLYRPTISTELPDGSLVVQRIRIEDDWSRCRNDWIIINQGRADTFSFSHRIFSGKELKDLLFRAGFREVTLFGSLTGEEYGPGAKRLVAVAYK